MDIEKSSKRTYHPIWYAIWYRWFVFDDRRRGRLFVFDIVCYIWYRFRLLDTVSDILVPIRGYGRIIQSDTRTCNLIQRGRWFVFDNRRWGGWFVFDNRRRGRWFMFDIVCYNWYRFRLLDTDSDILVPIRGYGRIIQSDTRTCNLIQICFILCYIWYIIM